MIRNLSVNPFSDVYVAKAEEYNISKLTDSLSEIGKRMQLPSLVGKRVIIKPNLVAKKSPDDPAIVNPAVIEAVIIWLKGLGADNITIAESPGGVYSIPRLKGIYSASGVAEVAARTDVKLNFDLGYSEISHPDGKICRLFEIIDPILSADVIVDVCKLKTHALTGMSAAIKNLFGTIPGIVKFEMHSRYPDYDDFASMLVDLCEMLTSRNTFISVTDAVIGMEGNGPTAGTPREIGKLIVSLNPFASDVVSSHIIGREGEIMMVNDAVSRGYAPATYADCRVVSVDGCELSSMKIKNFRQPDSAKRNTLEVIRGLFGGRIYKLFEPYPVIDYSRCAGCGECAASCPQHTIKMIAREDVKGASKSKASKVPVIERDACIRCFCCQELCPKGIIKIKKNPLTRLLS